jgi:hypothetical protein
VRKVDWENESFKITYSDMFAFFEDEGVVTILGKHPNRRGVWERVLPDMSPDILERAGFPDRIVKAARKVVKDRKTRIV